MLEHIVGLAVEAKIFELAQASIIQSDDGYYKNMVAEITSNQKGKDQLKRLQAKSGLNSTDGTDIKTINYWGTVVGIERAQLASKDRTLPLGESHGINLYLEGTKEFMDINSSQYCPSWSIKALPAPKVDEPEAKKRKKDRMMCSSTTQLLNYSTFLPSKL